MNILMILFVYLNTIISLAYCQNQNSKLFEYYIIVLKNNGILNISKVNVSIDENEDNKTISIANDKTLTIYQKTDDNQECSFSYFDDDNATIDNCRYRNASKDNICCLLNITATNKRKIYENSDLITDTSTISDTSDIPHNISEKTTWKTCVQVNKYEIKRFRGIPRVIYDNINAAEFDIGMIQCSTNYYKINELIIFGLLFIFLNF